MNYLRGDDVDYVFVDLIALSLAPLTSSILLSPAEMERALSKETPFFGTFRSKEMWLHPFEFMLRYPERFTVSDAAAAKIRSEMMRVGEPGPSPRLRERAMWSLTHSSTMPSSHGYWSLNGQLRKTMLLSNGVLTPLTRL